jgi:beta-lactamase class A
MSAWELKSEYQLPTSMILEHLQPGLMSTLHDLLAAMITVSDNTATDMVLAQVGIENVGRRLESWGLGDISIRKSVEGLFTDGFRHADSETSMPQIYRDVTAHAPLVDPFTGRMDERFMTGLQRGPNWDSPAAKRSMENNVATPAAMGALLTRLVQGELLSHQSTGIALDIMLRQQLNQRLPRFLPRTARMAHKTGTFFSARNDAGVLYLLDGAKVVMVVFAVLQREILDQDPLQSAPYIDTVDSTMGRIARTVYDAFA